MTLKKLVWGLLALVFLAGCASAQSTPVTPLPTCTPYPTFTPYPTYTPYPTSTPAPTQLPVTRAVDIARDLGLVNAINDYRVAHGAPALRVIPQLMNVAASRTYLGLVPVDLGKVQIDKRLMPSNYEWQEWASWGNDNLALSLRTPDAILKYWLTWKGMPQEALDKKYTDVGATYLCNGERCAFVIIYGVSH